MDYLLSDKHLTYVMLFKINNTSSDINFNSEDSEIPRTIVTYSKS